MSSVNHLFEAAATFRRRPVEKLVFVLLVYLDLALTFWALSLGFTELNPYVRSLLSSPLSFLILKGGASLLIAWLVPGKLLLPSIAFQFFVVSWDCKELILYFV